MPGKAVYINTSAAETFMLRALPVVQVRYVIGACFCHIDKDSAEEKLQQGGQEHIRLPCCADCSSFCPFLIMLCNCRDRGRTGQPRHAAQGAGQLGKQHCRFKEGARRARSSLGAVLLEALVSAACSAHPPAACRCCTANLATP